MLPRFLPIAIVGGLGAGEVLILCGLLFSFILAVSLAFRGRLFLPANDPDRLRRLERKVDLILGHLGLTAGDPLIDRVVELVDAGRKIEAIKAYREATGAGLNEAKDAVEAIAAKRNTP